MEAGKTFSFYSSSGNTMGGKSCPPSSSTSSDRGFCTIATNWQERG